MTTQPENTRVANVVRAATALKRHAEGLGGKCHHWSTEIASALDLAQDATANLEAIILALPDGFTPPRRTGGSPASGPVAGTHVTFTARQEANYTAVLNCKEPLTISAVAGEGTMVEVTDTDGKKALVLAKHLKAA